MIEEEVADREDRGESSPRSQVEEVEKENCGKADKSFGFSETIGQVRQS